MHPKTKEVCIPSVYNKNKKKTNSRNKSEIYIPTGYEAVSITISTDIIASLFINMTHNFRLMFVCFVFNFFSIVHVNTVLKS